jgi:hypothetical protein
MKCTQVELWIKGSENASKDLEASLLNESLEGIAVSSGDNQIYVNFTVNENPGEAVTLLGCSLAKNVSGADYQIVKRKYTSAGVIEESEEVETQMYHLVSHRKRGAA